MRVSSEDLCIAVNRCIFNILLINAFFSSTYSVLSDVKFDICDELAVEQNREFGESNTARGIDEYDFESNFEYPPHPLVVSYIQLSYNSIKQTL